MPHGSFQIGSKYRSELIVPDAQGMWAKGLDDKWRHLTKIAVDPNAFFGPEVLLPALEHLKGDQDIRIFKLWHGDALVGLMPLGPERFSRAKLPSISAWLHDQAFLGTPLVAPGAEAAFWEKLCYEAARPWWGGVLRIGRANYEGKVMSALLQYTKDAGMGLSVLRTFERAFLDTPTDCLAYQTQHIRGKKRKEWRRQRRRLAEIGNLTFSTSDTRTDVDSLIDDFLTLEAKGWKGRARTALAQDTSERAFFVDAIRSSAASGNLLVTTLRLDDTPIGMLIFFRAGSGSYSFKTCFDEDFSAYSPGVLVQLGSIEALSKAGVDWCDSCASKAHPMINALWAERVAIGDVLVALPGPTRQAYFKAIDLGERAYKKWKKDE